MMKPTAAPLARIDAQNPGAGDIAGAQTRTARLSLLLGLFAGSWLCERSSWLAAISYCRSSKWALSKWCALALPTGLLPRWPVVSRLQHARVTHLMSGDIHRVGGATHYMVQFAAAVVIIAPKADIRSSGLLLCKMTVGPHFAGRKTLL